MKRLIVLSVLIGMAFAANSYAADAVNVNTTYIKLIWDANSAADLAGYKLYHKTAETSAWDAPIDIPLSNLQDTANPEYTAENMPEGLNIFALTAYDDHGNESVFSDEAVGDKDTVAPEGPSGLKILITVQVNVGQ